MAEYKDHHCIPGYVCGKDNCNGPGHASDAVQKQTQEQIVVSTSFHINDNWCIANIKIFSNDSLVLWVVRFRSKIYETHALA